jgi:hypothetical protein
MSLLEEDTNYLRLAILVIKLSPKAVRVLFNNRFPAVNLPNILARKHVKLQALHDKRIISEAQWKLLFPFLGK